ncbi:MAG: OpgC domain-containing protein [Polyangiales bacterium]
MKKRVRLYELDVLRGVLLVVMTITHLPTRFRVYSHDAFGFVSAAEGFVFLSAFLVAARAASLPDPRTAERAWLARAGKLYTIHILLTVFAFGLAWLFADRPALRNVFGFLLAEPVKALIATPLLVYCPPLLDILPMYVVMLATTPMAWRLRARIGTSGLLAVSGSVWLCEQLGATAALQRGVSAAFGGIPAPAFGAFDWLGWQLLWTLGLCLGGSPHAQASLTRPVRPRYMALAVTACLGFCLLRWGEHVGLPLDAPRVLDKWRLAPLRLVNLACLAPLLVHYGPRIVRVTGGHLTSLLGRASLRVFCGHIVLCLIAYWFVDDADSGLPLWEEALVLGVTFGALIALAWASVPRQRMAALGTS